MACSDSRNTMGLSSDRMVRSDRRRCNKLTDDGAGDDDVTINSCGVSLIIAVVSVSVATTYKVTRLVNKQTINTYFDMITTKITNNTDCCSQLVSSYSRLSAIECFQLKCVIYIL